MQDNTTPTDPKVEEASVNPESPSQPEKKKNKLSKKWLFIIIGAVIVLAVAGFIGFKLLFNGERSQAEDARQSAEQQFNPDQQNIVGGGGTFLSQYGQDCEDKSNVLFTSAPLPIGQLGHIEPLGKMEDGHVTPTDHLYVSPLNTQAADNTTDVVMPADGRVVMVAAMPAQYIGDRDQKTAPEDHRIVVSYSCNLYSIFIHVHQLSSAVKAVVGTLEPNAQKTVSISLKAGEKIGKIGGNPVDWTMVDTSKRLTGFISPDLYASEAWKIHTIDPFPLYTGSLKDSLIAKSLRSAEPYGGKIDYDQAGKLVGTWFREGTNGYSGASQDRYWDGHLSIVPDYIDTKSTIVSIGNWNGKASQFVVKSPVATPDQISKDNGVIAYSLVKRAYVQPNGQPWTGSGLVKGITLDTLHSSAEGVILLQVLDGNKLKVETFPGKTADQQKAFTSAAQTYVR